MRTSTDASNSTETEYGPADGLKRQRVRAIPPRSPSVSGGLSVDSRLGSARASELTKKTRDKGDGKAWNGTKIHSFVRGREAKPAGRKL
jgi:hypothetical protein